MNFPNIFAFSVIISIIILAYSADNYYVAIPLLFTTVAEIVGGSS